MLSSLRCVATFLRPRLAFASLGLSLAGGALRAADAVTFSPGDHVAIVGNGLADRMQHHGWLETMIHQRHPDHRLVFRNLAFSGDEVAIRPRSQDFGTPDQWLTRVQANTVFAFFGFNESFRGAAGLPQFRQELEQFLRSTRAKNYSGLGAPRIVLFSPIATEAHPNRDLQLPAENNANLALYTQAMAEVTRDVEGVTFVDLFTPSQQLFAAAARNGEPPLTFNGVHLTEAGEARLAAVVYPLLFGGAPAPAVNPALRAAVNDKNAMWHTRYRSLDGFNTYGGRSQNHLYFGGEGRPQLTNAQVMQEEFAQRDVLTANRDFKVWSLARGGGGTFEELPLPTVTPVPTSKPGTNPDGSHVFLGGEEAIAKMTVHPGLRVNLFASEAQFPELRKPVQMAWDTRGRLWVAVWPNYPLRRPDSKEGDKLLIFEDSDGDGRADKCTTFIDDLDCPTGFQFYKDGVLLVQAPDLWYIRDTDGDGRADTRERVLMGLDSADTHHQSNSLSYDPGGAVYLSDGLFHRTQVETAEGPVRNIDAAIYRYEPRTQRFETYASYGFANPHGRSFDRWGNDLITDATGNRTYFGPAFSGRIDYPGKHATLKPFWPNPSRPSAASTILSSRHFPDEFQGNFLNGNVIRFQGIYRVKVVDDGAGYKGEQLTDFLSSSDPNFRPSGIDVGPDGAVYLLDWHSPIIAHTNLNHLRDPNRGFEYGRIYRITHRERPLLPRPRIRDQPIPALLELLKSPESRTRELAKIELDRHETGAVVAALREWIGRLDPRDPNHAHHLLEALWVHQWQNVVNQPLLEQLLRSPEPEARAAATRVLSYWRDRVPNALALLRARADDEHPRVRLHAVRAASFFRSAEAVEVALTAIRHPLDYYLDYTLDETLRQLTPQWRDQLQPGSPLLAGDPKRVKHLLRTVTNEALLTLPRSREVLETIMTRAGLADSARTGALADLAGLRGVTPSVVLLDYLESGEKVDVPAFGRLLLAQPRADLVATRARIAALSKPPAAAGRSAYWAALVLADGSFDTVWREAEDAPKLLADLLTGIPLIADSALRASAYPRVARLLSPPAGQPVPAASVRQAAIRAAVSTRQDMSAQFQAFSRFIQRGEDIPVAAEGMRALPRSHWSEANARPLAAALVEWAKKSPENARRGAAYLGVTQLADELAGKLPATEAADIRKALAGLRTATFLIRTVPEEMRFDVSRIVVEKGKAFTIVFENPDAMPHNLVVVKPGTREKVGQAALELRADYVDRLGRAFVPDTSDVVAATKLIDRGESASVRVDAPLAEGEYEYVCTFPGHWVTMWGRLIVTTQPDAVLATTATPAADPSAPTHQHDTRPTR